MSYHRYINGFVIHATAGWQHQTIPELRKVWTDLGWKQVGYHVVILPDGTRIRLADNNQVTNGVSGYNHDRLHICWMGGLISTSKSPTTGKTIYHYGDNRTPEQKEALAVGLVEDFYKELLPYQPIDHITITGHRDLSKDLNGNGIIEPREWVKECPMFDAITEYGWLAGHAGLENMLHRSTY